MTISALIFQSKFFGNVRLITFPLPACPPNSTHRLQPLDDTFFSSLKNHWRKVLSDYKKASNKPINKMQFPKFLKEVGEKWKGMGGTLVSGFAATGIWPIDPSKPKKHIKHVPDLEDQEHFVSDSLVSLLSEKRQVPPQLAASKHGKRIKVTPGASLSAGELQADECAAENDNSSDPEEPYPDPDPEEFAGTSRRRSRSPVVIENECKFVVPLSSVVELGTFHERDRPTWVAIFYMSGGIGTAKWYICQVKNFTKEGKVKLRSLARVEPLKYDVWVWPKWLDIGVYDDGDLLCVLKKAPKLAK